jgi:hypothetical protein
MELEDIVRVGIVSVVDKPNRCVRVIFNGQEKMVSGWLKVIKSPPFIPAKDVPQRTEHEAGGSGYAEYASHKHDVIVSPWLPDVNDTVLCLYLPVFNGDGYVLGAI